MNFTISVYGVKHAAEEIEGWGGRARNTRPAMEEIYLTILDIEQETFEKEGARGGFARWQKLALSTLVAKVKKNLHPYILRESDKLLRAMTTYRSSDAYTKIENSRIIFQPKLTTLPYGRIHQLGGVAGGSHIPARPYIRFTQQDSRSFARELMRHLRGSGGAGKIGISFE